MTLDEAHELTPALKDFSDANLAQALGAIERLVDSIFFLDAQECARSNSVSQGYSQAQAEDASIGLYGET